jgi:anaerobic selenocysteine-containing dehydrogenase
MSSESTSGAGSDVERGGTERVSFCRICTAYCGVIVTVDGDQVVGLRGDRDHPASRGYTCSKGRALPAFHHSPTRLDNPRLRGRLASWAECLDDLGSALQGVVATAGPDTIGTYIATGHYSDKAGLYAERRLFGKLGTPQCYSSATVDVAPAWRAAEMVTGYAQEVNPVWDPDDDLPSLAIVIGQNPVISHGYLSILTDPVRRITGFRRRGGRVWVIDPRRTETAALADRHLAPRPGTDGVLLGWLVRELLEGGGNRSELVSHADESDLARLRTALDPFTAERVSARCDVPLVDLHELLGEVRSAGQVACVVGTGVTFGPEPVVTEWLRWLLLIVTGSVDREGGMRCPPGFFAPPERRAEWIAAPPDGRRDQGPRSRPELGRWLGEYPCTALVDEIEAGHLRALVVGGGNPLTSLPDPERTAAALRSLDVLAVVGVSANELTEMATHVLPVAGQLERADVSLRDRGAFTDAVVPIAAERRPAWWVYAQLGRRLGIDVLDGRDPDSCDDTDVLAMLVGAAPDRFAAARAAGPHGAIAPSPPGWVHDLVLPGGRWRIAPIELVDRLPRVWQSGHDAGMTLVSRRQARAMNSTRYVRPADETQDLPCIRLHPDDAAALGIDEGTTARMRNHNGVLDGNVAFDPRMRRGVASVTNGWSQTNVNHLVSRVEEVETLTGQPRMTCVPVDIQSVRDETAAH